MSEEKYLVVKGRSGLGNRMQCVLTAMLYAHLMRRRLIVDWSESGYSSDGTNTFSKLFCGPDIDRSFTIPMTESVYPAIWRGHLDKSATDMLGMFEKDKWSSATIYRKYSAEFERLDYEEDVVVMWCLTQLIRRLRRHFTGEFAWLRPMSDEAIMRRMLREELLPQPIIRERVDDFQSKHFRRPTIGVHIRSTDRRSPVEAFHRALGQVMKHHPDAQVFLATDSKQVEQTMRERYRDVICTEKWFPSEGGKMHENNACPDRLRNAIEALVDMYLLGACDYLIYPRVSTFSYMSSLISDAPRGHIIDVQRFHLGVRLRRVVRSWVE